MIQIRRSSIIGIGIRWVEGWRCQEGRTIVGLEGARLASIAWWRRKERVLSRRAGPLVSISLRYRTFSFHGKESSSFCFPWERDEGKLGLTQTSSPPLSFHLSSSLHSSTNLHPLATSPSLLPSEHPSSNPRSLLHSGSSPIPFSSHPRERPFLQLDLVPHYAFSRTRQSTRSVGYLLASHARSNS